MANAFDFARRDSARNISLAFLFIGMVDPGRARWLVSHFSTMSIVSLMPPRASFPCRTVWRRRLWFATPPTLRALASAFGAEWRHLLAGALCTARMSPLQKEVFAMRQILTRRKSRRSLH